MVISARPKELSGKTYRVTTGCGKIYVIINRDEQGIKEIFTTLGRSGSCSRATNEALARCISIGLQNGVSIELFISTLKGIRCDKPMLGQEHVQSCSDAIAKCLEEDVESQVNNE